MKAPDTPRTPTRLILDTDPGVDDAIAILLALAAPHVDVVGLTTVGGNVPLARATRNALALLQAAGRIDVPVARGAARPLWGRFRPSVAFHGPGGLSARLPDSSSSVVDTTAVDFLRNAISSAPGEVTIVALGPLTNMSRLERQNPGLLSQTAQLIVMGGAVETRGNVTPLAEFNFHSDPNAANHVLGLDAPVFLVDLAACRQVGIDRDHAARVSSDNPLGRVALRMLHGWFAREERRQRFEFYDPLAVAMALDPGVTTFRPMSVSVGTTPGEQWGETTVTGKEGTIALANQVDTARFFALLRNLLGWRGL